MSGTHQQGPVRVGLERCLEDPRGVIGQARFGLLMHQASVDRRLRYACDLLASGTAGPTEGNLHAATRVVG